jgi:glycosyltransferase involved in cell wall biosynthesis
MNVLSIGTDRNIFIPGSAVRERQVLYAHSLSQVHTIVCTLRTHGYTNQEVDTSLYLYATNSSFRMWYIWDALRIGMKIIKTKHFVRGDAIITCQDPFETGLIGVILSWIYRIPLHIQVHTDIYSPYFATTTLQKIRVHIARFVLSYAHRVRVVHKDIATSFVRHGITLRHEASVLPVRVNKELIEQAVPFDFKKTYPQFHIIILMVNRLSPEKGVDTALRVCKDVIDNYSFVGLCIAGDGVEKAPLTALATELGIEKNVVFLGKRDDIGSLLKSSHIFLSTSRFEGYGMTLVEAGLTKTAVVTTDVGLAHTLIIPEHNGIICAVDDEQAIKRGLIDLINYPLKRAEYGKELYAVVESSVLPQDAYIKEYIEDLTETLHQ